LLLQNPQIKHGAIKILFTPEEEIGRGADKVDPEKLGAIRLHHRWRNRG